MIGKQSKVKFCQKCNVEIYLCFFFTVCFLGKFGQKEYNKKHIFVDIDNMDEMEKIMMSEEENIAFIEQVIRKEY